MKLSRVTVLIPIALAVSACGSPSYSTGRIEDSVISTCQNAVKKLLKDPESVRFGSDWTAKQAHPSERTRVTDYHPGSGDLLFSATGSVNAKNSFGGYVGDERYGCDAIVTPERDISASAYPLNKG